MTMRKLSTADCPGGEALRRRCAGAQLQGWCQASCLNRARQRRRHRRAIEDWAFLHQHAANADASPDFAAWLPAGGWAWQAEPDALVGGGLWCPQAAGAPPPPPPPGGYGLHCAPLTELLTMARTITDTTIIRHGVSSVTPGHLPQKEPGRRFHVLDVKVSDRKHSGLCERQLARAPCAASLACSGGTVRLLAGGAWRGVRRLAVRSP